MDEDAVVRPTALHAKLNSTKLNLNLKKKRNIWNWREISLILSGTANSIVSGWTWRRSSVPHSHTNGRSLSTRHSTFLVCGWRLARQGLLLLHTENQSDSKQVPATDPGLHSYQQLPSNHAWLALHSHSLTRTLQGHKKSYCSWVLLRNLTLFSVLNIP